MAGHRGHPALLASEIADVGPASGGRGAQDARRRPARRRGRRGRRARRQRLHRHPAGGRGGYQSGLMAQLMRKWTRISTLIELLFHFVVAWKGRHQQIERDVDRSRWIERQKREPVGCTRRQTGRTDSGRRQPLEHFRSGAAEQRPQPHSAAQGTNFQFPFSSFEKEYKQQT